MELTVKRYDELTLDELYEIIRVRLEVFVTEQKCIYNDLDNIDKQAYHVFLHEGGSILGYLRVYALDGRTVKIGRVLTTVRSKGYGEAVVRRAIEVAFKMMNADGIIIHSQSHAVGFYEKCGFEVYGEEFLEENIPHRYMRLKKRD